MLFRSRSLIRQGSTVQDHRLTIFKKAYVRQLQRSISPINDFMKMSHLTIMHLFRRFETASNRFLMQNFNKLVERLKFWAIFIFYTDFDNSCVQLELQADFTTFKKVFQI